MNRCVLKKLTYNVCKTIGAMTVVAGLQGCGGGGNSELSFTQLGQSGGDMLLKHYYQPQTSVSNLPVGNVSYSGVASFNNSPVINAEFINTADPLAKIQLDLNVASNSVSGKITNIKSFNGSPSSGTVNISNGNFVDNTFIADTNGSVLYQGQVSSVTGKLDGMFLGSNGEAVFGTSAGTFGGQPFYGAYIAEK